MIQPFGRWGPLQFRVSNFRKNLFAICLSTVLYNFISVSIDFLMFRDQGLAYVYIFFHKKCTKTKLVNYGQSPQKMKPHQSLYPRKFIMKIRKTLAVKNKVLKNQEPLIVSQHFNCTSLEHQQTELSGFFQLPLNQLTHTVLGPGKEGARAECSGPVAAAPDIIKRMIRGLNCTRWITDLKVSHV